MMYINPFQDLPEDVREGLLKAGWIPGKPTRCSDANSGFISRIGRWLGGKPVRRSDHGLAGHEAARQVLEQLAGLEIAPTSVIGKERPLRVFFETAIAEGYEEEIEELGKRLHVQLAPIGNVGNGVAILLMADSGHILLLGYADKGAMVVGTTFGEGMSRVLGGRKAKPIVFSDDPNRTFWNDEFEADPTAFRPGPEGLNSLIEMNPRANP